MSRPSRCCACPYGQRFWIEAPHPMITHARLREIPAPQPGETVLEVGPVTGCSRCRSPRWIAPGTLHALDVQRPILDHTRDALRRGHQEHRAPARRCARAADGDATFDAAYLVTVLGEVPDRDVTLRELRRVIKPEGRVVAGELFGDPHMVGEGTLHRRAAAAGLRFDRRVGPPFGYFAVLRPEESGR